MNFKYILILLPTLAICLVMAVFLGVLLRRYVKVGPSQVLIVSGRRRQLADGTQLGFRIVKGGGTFVFPVIEKAERFSLEVFSIAISKFKARTAHGQPVEADCVAVLKIKGDDASILAAAEHFLGKSEVDMQTLVRPMLEKNLRAVLANSSLEEPNQTPESCADRVQAAASSDLGGMG